MKRIPLALIALNLIALPANATTLTGDRDIQYGDLLIPKYQALSPAGHPGIGLRPSCEQVIPSINVSDQSLTDWGVWVPDGSHVVFDTYPVSWSNAQALNELNGYGFCKLGGVTVPIIHTHQLPESVLPGPVAQASNGTPTSAAELTTGTNAPMVLLGLLLSAAGIAWIAYVIYGYSKKGKDPAEDDVGEGDLLAQVFAMKKKVAKAEGSKDDA